jgi:hypothetical protein
VTRDERLRSLDYRAYVGPDPGENPHVEVTLVSVTAGGACTSVPGARPARGNHLTVALTVRYVGRPLMMPVTANDLAIKGADGGVDEDAGASRCDIEAGWLGRRLPDGSVQFVLDTRYRTGTITFTHTELDGTATWTY